MRISTSAIALSLALLTGCATVNMGDPAKDLALKEFKAPVNMAGIYIFRNESMGGAVRMDVDIDGRVLGETASKTYLYSEVSPGKHTITSKAENIDTLELDAKPGMLYYIWQEVKMGLMYARNKLQLVNPADGQKGVQESKLAATR